MPKILLIEDNKNNADIMKRVLKRNGHTVFHEAKGLEGLAVATKEEVDIALVDLGLPDVGGATIVSLLKRLPKNIPIVVVTASFNQADWRQVVNRGVIGYMTKPINTRTFAFEVEKFLEQAVKNEAKSNKTKSDSSKPAASLLF